MWEYDGVKWYEMIWTDITWYEHSIKLYEIPSGKLGKRTVSTEHMDDS